jgi:hypothetical protein
MRLLSKAAGACIGADEAMPLKWRSGRICPVRQINGANARGNWASPDLSPTQ